MQKAQEISKRRGENVSKTQKMREICVIMAPTHKEKESHIILQLYDCLNKTKRNDNTNRCVDVEDSIFVFVCMCVQNGEVNIKM